MKIIDLKINRKIINNLLNQGYEDLTEIQEQTINKILRNENIFGLAQTGSGKTAAFLVPIIENISKNRSHKALIITPTRDLAEQVYTNALKYAKFLGLRTARFFGGTNMDLQAKFLSDGIDIMIGTPGRIIDLYNKKHLNLSNINYLVLDEADQMLDMGFINDMRFIVNKMTNRIQTSLFSATSTREIEKLAKEVMGEFKIVKVKNKIDIRSIIDQKIYIVSYHNKLSLLIHILGDSRRTLQQCIVFTRTKKEADEISKFLKYNKFKADALHSDRTQQSRTKILNEFRTNQLQILVATNVAARGIDISNLPLVINYDIPEQKEIYVHRIGRTGRAGKQGEAITFCTPKQKYEIKELEKVVKMKIPVIEQSKYIDKKQDAIQLNLKRKNNKNRKSNQIKNKLKSNSKKHNTKHK